MISWTAFYLDVIQGKLAQLDALRDKIDFELNTELPFYVGDTEKSGGTFILREDGWEWSPPTEED